MWLCVVGCHVWRTWAHFEIGVENAIEGSELNGPFCGSLEDSKRCEKYRLYRLSSWGFRGDQGTGLGAICVIRSLRIYVCSSTGVEGLAVINETSVSLRWNLWISVRKYLLQVNLEVTWSKLAKATILAGSPSWQCVRALMWYWFWKPDKDKTDEAWKAAGTWIVGLEPLTRCQERPLVSMQSQLQWWLQGIGHFQVLRYHQDSGRCEVDLAWSCEMRPYLTELEKGDCQCLFRGRRLYSDIPMLDIDLKDFNLQCIQLFWLSLCTLILLLCNKKTCNLFSFIL